MHKLARVALYLFVVILLALPVTSCLQPSKASNKAMLPAGFNGVKLPGPHLDGFLYLNQGSPFYFGPDITNANMSLPKQANQAALSLFPAGDSEDLLYSIDNVNWQNALSTAAVASGVSLTTLQESYPEAWNLLQHLPQIPPDKIIGAGFLKATGNIYNSLWRIGIDSETAAQIAQNLEKAKVSQVAFGIYSKSSVDTISFTRVDTTEEGGLSILIIGKTELGVNIFGRNFFGDFFLKLGLSATLAKDPVVDKDAFVFMAAPTGPVFVKEVAGFTYVAVADEDAARALFTSLNSSGADANLKYQLAEKYAPILYMHPNEIYEPQDVRVMIENSNLRMKPFMTTIPMSQPLSPLDLYNISQREDSTNLYLDINGLSPQLMTQTSSSVAQEYANSYASIKDNYPATVYAHVFPFNGETVLQYWLFYFFDDGPENLHEGDWEYVQVNIKGEDLQNALTLGVPTLAVYSQHFSYQYAAWNRVSLAGNHPFVYVARGSHANYFSPGDWTFMKGISADSTSGSGRIIFPPMSDDEHGQTNYNLTVLPELSDLAKIGSEQPWLAYKGMWGEWLTAAGNIVGANGPYGPNTRKEWSEPITDIQ